jgi:hypothetical protein
VLVNNIVSEINSNRQDYTTNKSNMHKSLVGLINCKKFLLALIFGLTKLCLNKVAKVGVSHFVT